MPIFSKQLGAIDYSSPEAVKSIAKHLRVMQEELEYRLMFLDSSNISEIDASQTKIITPEGDLYSLIGNLNGDYSLFEQTIEGFEATVETYEKTVDGYTKKMSEYQQSVDGFSQTVKAYEETVDGYTEKVSEYKQSVDGFSQTVSAYEQTVDGYTKQVSTFQQTVNGFNTKVESYEQTVDGYTQKVSEYNQTVDGFSQTVSSYSSAVDGYAKQVSSFEQTLNGFKFSVQNGEASSTLTLTSGDFSVTSPEIKFTGAVTFKDLSTEGNTTIHGGNIQTDSITSDALHLTGELTVYDGSTSGAIGGYMGYTTSNLKGGGSGMCLRSASGDGEISVTDSGARLGVTDSDGNYNQIYIGKDNAAIATRGLRFWFTSGENGFYTKVEKGDFKAVSLGCASNPWGHLYAQDSTITTSDRNAKNSIEVLPEKYLTMFDRLTPRRFKFNAGTSNRYHVGFIAQEVEEAMAAAGVDSKEFGGFVKDTTEDGEEVYMLRYEEFIGILAAKVQALEARVAQEG